MVIEKKLAQCEGKWALALRHTIEQKALPEDDSLADLLTFVAFMAVRIPWFRKQVTDFIDRASKAELRATFATAEGRQRFLSFVEEHVKMLSPSERKRVQELLDSDPDLDEMADYVMSEAYTVSYDQTWNVQTMIQTAISLLPELGKRQWRLWTVGSDGPDLICSDCPVCLTWTKDVHGPYPPGFGLRNTLLTVPLSKRLMLASTFEEMPKAVPLTHVHVAEMNSRTGRLATQLYSPEAGFTWLMPDGQISNADSNVCKISERTRESDGSLESG